MASKKITMLNKLMDIQYKRLKTKEIELEELYVKGKTEIIERELYFVKGRIEQINETKAFMESITDAKTD